VRAVTFTVFFCPERQKSHSTSPLLPWNISQSSTFSFSSDAERSRPWTHPFFLSLFFFPSFFLLLFSLSFCSCSLFPTTKPLASLSYIGEGCHNLQNLDLRECRRVTDFGLRDIGLGCPNLKFLDLVGCAKVTDLGIVALGKGCQHLQSLDLVSTFDYLVSTLGKEGTITDNITDIGLKQIGISCLHLCSLHISGECS